MYPTLLAHLRDLRRLSRADEATVQAWQLRRFREMFHHARTHSAFYRRLYREAGVLDLEVRTLEDIRRIPWVDKARLRESSLEDHLTCGVDGPGFTLHSTSGSTGEPYRIWSRKEEEFTGHVRVLWMLMNEGYHPGKAITMVTRLDADARLEVEDSLSLLGFVQSRMGLFRRTIISVFEDPDEILGKIAHAPPDILWSTTSIMDIVARRAREEGVFLDLPVLVLMSETLHAGQRALLHEHVARRVVHLYGLIECPSAAVSFNTPERYDVLTAGTLMEYRRSPEELGEDRAELVVTNLVNRTQPFIRYRTGDLVRVPADAGDFPTRSIPTVLGRIDDILTLRSGRECAHHHAHEMFMGFHECEQWKFVQKVDGAVALRLKIADGSDPTGVKRRALEIWRHRFPEEDLRVDFVDEMGVDPVTGKFKNIEKLRA